MDDYLEVEDGMQQAVRRQWKGACASLAGERIGLLSFLAQQARHAPGGPINSSSSANDSASLFMARASFKRFYNFTPAFNHWPEPGVTKTA